MLKLARRARGHFVTLIEIRVHLIRVKPGHICLATSYIFLKTRLKNEEGLKRLQFRVDRDSGIFQQSHLHAFCMKWMSSRELRSLTMKLQSSKRIYYCLA